MDYDRIILEMLDRIKTLEDEVAALKNSKTPESSGKDEMKSSKKYRRLTEILVAAEGKPVSLIQTKAGIKRFTFRNCFWIISIPFMRKNQKAKYPIS